MTPRARRLGFGVVGAVILLLFGAALLQAWRGTGDQWRSVLFGRHAFLAPFIALYFVCTAVPKRWWQRAGSTLLGRPATFPALAIVIATALLLRAEGRIWWCAHGDLAPWTSDAWGPHNSQHLLDPYTFTHVLHGLVFWGVLVLAAPGLAASWRCVVGLGVEAAWEVMENTPWAIERYRAATAAVGYTGDTVLNALGDVAACGLGLALAARLGWRRSLAIFVVTELVLLVWIRDGLVLNVLMLLHPIDAIRQWQAMPR